MQEAQNQALEITGTLPRRYSAASVFHPHYYLHMQQLRGSE